MAESMVEPWAWGEVEGAFNIRDIVFVILLGYIDFVDCLWMRCWINERSVRFFYSVSIVNFNYNKK